jgi:hypothetical protein
MGLYVTVINVEENITTGDMGWEPAEAKPRPGTSAGVVPTSGPRARTGSRRYARTAARHIGTSCRYHRGRAEVTRFNWWGDEDGQTPEI